MPPHKQSRPMSSRDIEEMLQRHADALVSGQDITPELIEENPYDERRLNRLLGLNRELNDSMKPVEPSRSYVSSLRERLADAYAVGREEQERQTQQMKARVGTGLGALVVVGLVVRVIGAIIMIVAFVTKTRRRNATA